MNKETQSKEIVESFVKSIFLGGKLEEISKYVHPDVIAITCGGIKGEGLVSTLEALRKWSKAFNILENECLCSVSSDTQVLEHWRVKAIHIGEFLNVSPSNKVVTFSGVSIYEIKDGKIANIMGYSDFLLQKNL